MDLLTLAIDLNVILEEWLMKFIKLLFGIYQLILSVIGLSFLIFSGIMISRSNPDNVHWLMLICVLFTVGTGIGFCSLSGVRFIFSSRNLLEKFKGLTPISIVFTILLTLVLGILLAGTDWDWEAFSEALSQELNSPFQRQLSPSPLLKQNAPDFSANDINGNPIRLSDLRGKYVLLDFWATWCGPCVKELPNVQKARESFPEDKLVILGINKDRDISILKSFLKEQTYTFSQIFDEKGEISSLYRVSGIPMNFLINPNGVVVDTDMRGRRLLKVISSHIKNGI